MKNKVKKALFCAALAACSGAFAGGPLDGAFDCRVTYPGNNSFSVGMAVVTNVQGVTAFAPIALSSTNQIFGYGLGTASGNIYSGATNYGQPFSFSFNPQAVSFSGTISVVVNGVPVPTSASCLKVF